MYPGDMPTMTGPCVDCGKVLEKYVRPGKQLRCFDCALLYMTSAQMSQATEGTDEWNRSMVLGRDFARQYRQGEGAWYERWRRGMTEYLERLEPTE